MNCCLAFILAFSIATSAWAQTPQDTTTILPDGYLRLEVDADSVLVIADDLYDAFVPLEHAQLISLQPGTHRITLASARFPDVTRLVDISSGDTTTLGFELPYLADRKRYLEMSSYPVLTTGARLYVITEDDADVYVGGNYMGRGSMFVNSVFGDNLVETRHALAGRNRKSASILTVTPPRLMVLEMYTKPNRFLSKSLSLLPGASQFYEGKNLKGVAFISVFWGSLAFTVLKHQAFTKENESYMAISREYETASTEESATLLGDQAKAQYQVVKQLSTLRNIAASAALSTFIVSLIDGWLPPKGGYRIKKAPTFYFTSSESGLTVNTVISLN